MPKKSSPKTAAKKQSAPKKSAAVSVKKKNGAKNRPTKSTKTAKITQNPATSSAAQKPAKTPKSRRTLPTRNPLKLLWLGIVGIGRWVATLWRKLRGRVRNFMQRRPHRSFRVTRRRDYVRSFKISGYFAFTFEVLRVIWGRKKLFLWLAIIYIILTVVFGLMGSQEIYGNLRSVMAATAPEELFGGAAGEVAQAGILLFTALTTGISGEIEALPAVIAGFLALYLWLTVVWLLRRIIAGKMVKLRDGLYNAGAPILPTFLVLLILLVQLVPAAAAMIVAGAAWQSGIVDGGAISMLVALGLLLVLVLSLYWITSTLVALVVVTLPGMYPLQALTISGDLVIGRRLRVLYRLLWMIFVTLSWWVVLMIPIILFDGWIKSVFEQISWLPIVPVAMLLLSTVTIIWSCTYIYMLYRRMVDDDAAPA